MPTDRFVTRPAHTAATLELGARFALAVRAADLDQLLVELRGELGAGKTVFVRGLARGLGLPRGQRVVSPTFTLARAYPVQTGGRIGELHHVDAYRLRGAEELEAAGFEAMCGDGRLTCVEWGEHVEEALPVDRVRVSLRVLLPEKLAPGAAPECPREITFTAGGARSARVLAALREALTPEETSS